MITKTGIKVFSLFLILGILISLVSCETGNGPEPEPEPVPLNVEIIRGSMEDIDGNVYETVIIGGQEWMAENLKTSRYRNESAIEYIGGDNDAWITNTTGAYSWYHNLESNKDVYGAVYNWYAVNNPAGLCPDGWRVPSNLDWTELEEYLMAAYNLSNSRGNPGALGNRLKSCRQVRSPMGVGCATSVFPRWHNHDDHYGFDDFGFAALPIGSRRSDGSYIANPGFFGNWWSRDADGEVNAFNRYLTYDNGQIFSGSTQKINGYAVRCVR